MNKMIKQVRVLLLLGVIVAMSSMLSLNNVHAQTGGNYDLTWWTIDGGGDVISGNGYTLNGTIGQPEPGSAPTGSNYTLTGGFWNRFNSYKVFLPLILK